MFAQFFLPIPVSAFRHVAACFFFMPPCKAKHACTQTHKHTTPELDLCILLYFCCCFFCCAVSLGALIGWWGGARVGQDQPDPAAHRTVVTHHGANATNLSTLDYPSRMKHHTYAIHLIVMTNAHNHRPRTDSHASLIAMHTHTHMVRHGQLKN